MQKKDRNPTSTPEWKALGAHYRQMQEVHLRTLFKKDPDRAARMSVAAAGLYLDYSKNRVTDATVKKLLALAEARGLRAAIEAMFSGQRINETENRPVLHVALRNRSSAPIRASIRSGSGP